MQQAAGASRRGFPLTFWLKAVSNNEGIQTPATSIVDVETQVENAFSFQRSRLKTPLILQVFLHLVPVLLA